MIGYNMITLFELRDRIYNQIKRIEGFKGITINSELGENGIITIYVADYETKETLYEKYGDMQDEYYIIYIIKGNGIEFL